MCDDSRVPDFIGQNLTGSRFDVYLTNATDDKLAGMTEPVTEPGYPEPESFPVRRCLGAVVNEEWEHRLYAERDLDVLESRSS